MFYKDGKEVWLCNLFYVVVYFDIEWVKKQFYVLCMWCFNIFREVNMIIKEVIIQFVVDVMMMCIMNCCVMCLYCEEEEGGWLVDLCGGEYKCEFCGGMYCVFENVCMWF